MNKKELVQTIAGKADTNLTQAEKALNGVLDAISDTLTVEGRKTCSGRIRYIFDKQKTGTKGQTSTNRSRS